MTPLEIFDVLFYKHIRNVAILNLADIFHPNFKMNLGIRLYFISIIIGMSCMVFTIATREKLVALNTCTAWGLAIQVGAY